MAMEDRLSGPLSAKDMGWQGKACGSCGMTLRPKEQVNTTTVGLHHFNLRTCVERLREVMGEQFNRLAALEERMSDLEDVA